MVPVRSLSLGLSMSVSLRTEALRSYKQLLRTCHLVFGADRQILFEAQRKARSMFRANKHVRDEQRIKELIAEADDATLFMYRDLIKVTYDATQNSSCTFCSISYTSLNKTKPHSSTLLVHYLPLISSATCLLFFLIGSNGD